MPAAITHHIFGEDASRLLPDGLLSSEEELLAFLLGNQGPDPLWARFRTSPFQARACHALASAIHESRVVETLMALRNATEHMRPEDNRIARAFSLGLSAHYLLDSIMHPLIYAQQIALCEADPSLAGAQAEVHALLESDIDVWMLWQTRQKTVLDSPTSSAFYTTERINHVAGALMAQAAWEVFGIEVGGAEYGGAVGDYRLMYRLLDPPARRLPHLLARIEKVARPHSRLAAQTHPATVDDECPAANLAHAPWHDPDNGELSLASAADLFHDALIAWPMFSRRYAEGDRRWLTAAVNNINYNGRTYL